MTYKEGIYDVRESMKMNSIDSDITDRQIAFLMRIYRATVVRQFITNNPGEHRDMLSQSLYMELELVPKNRFPSYSDSSYTLLSTKLSLPNIIGQQMYKEYEVRIDDMVGVELEMIHKDRIVEVRYAPDNFIYGYREDDGKLKFVGKNKQYKNLTRVVVTAILENPEDELDVNPNMDELVRYPITAHLWATVKDMIMQQIAKEMNVPMDLLNDKRDEQSSTGAQKQN